MYAHIRVITKHKKYHPPAIREVKLYQHVKDRISKQSLNDRFASAKVRRVKLG